MVVEDRHGNKAKTFFELDNDPTPSEVLRRALECKVPEWHKDLLEPVNLKIRVGNYEWCVHEEQIARESRLVKMVIDCQLKVTSSERPVRINTERNP